MRISWLSKILILVFSVLLCFVAYFVYNFQSINNRPFSSDVKINVKEGDTLNNVIDELANQGKLRNHLFVKISLKVFNYDTNIKPGEYSFGNDVSLGTFMAFLNKGVLNEFVKVTVPEGYSIEAMGELFEKSGLNFTKQDFLNEVRYYPLPKYVKNIEERRYLLEGFLFPDTYHFDKDSTPNVVIKTMIDRFEQVLKEIETELKVSVPEDKIDDIVTMASIVEREIIHDEERVKAASVFYNRLRVGMPLQSCATVIYALGKHKEVLYNSDLEVDSKYNTYKYSSLPIGPIASPGRESIKAAISPSDTNYLYFILNDETNYHYFFENYSDFLKQKAIRDTTLAVKK
ncbi:hypothetical protein SFBM_0835 [Candidatus Arthromitus sp. SFB-mouse-Japan]|uniref:endolytic transglycosylase MltG n=1 Tax=unclassified Candidatus Neoarthromitus TaxID=2638829 RepID=UPI00021B7D3C|nr:MULTISPECIES: endolytic transglycosylase MltG [unclassified Candidatus Arthromitus]AID44815.1 Hypothetical protein SFBmNL_00907 [Candidatus Arthromitus sp. SFB-mouse-NL]EGX28719.1 YceG-like domain-containing protein [Candidatus Arthromitus sp. SFB-mouse-NYU]BAK56604.1 hypothetical protein SFBM_0835 [Candidatus Arthromitus sp. SFB-mouse-Japan]BAK79919.1 4-amino-4-deoxychorismate lyase [Candidatus Arthromitus sp. SFB-mouse-Yit]